MNVNEEVTAVRSTWYCFCFHSTSSGCSKIVFIIYFM